MLPCCTPTHPPTHSPTHLSRLHRNTRCSISPPIKRDYSWLGYKELNGFAYRNVKAVGGFFETRKNIISIKSCFKACADSRNPGSVCLSFRYEPAAKRCGLSTYTIPFDPTDAQDLKTATKWCPERGYNSGWLLSEHD